MWGNANSPSLTSFPTAGRLLPGWKEQAWAAPWCSGWHCCPWQGLEVDDLWGPFQPQPFYDSFYDSKPKKVFLGWDRFGLWDRWQEQNGNGCAPPSSLTSWAAVAAGEEFWKDTAAFQVSRPQRGAPEEAEDNFICGAAAPVLEGTWPQLSVEIHLVA